MLSPLELCMRHLRVGEPDECWPYGGFRDRDGYGQFSSAWSGAMSCYRAHRVMYEGTVASVPAGLVLDHLCRNRACCNPAHLEPVTHRENIMRGVGVAAVNAARTHCVNGHEFTADNTYLRKRPGGGRICKACIFERQRIRRGGDARETTSVSAD